MVTALVALLLQQPVADLDTVIRRATDYVSRYEAELGNLIGTEDYVQNATLLDSSGTTRNAKAGCAGFFHTTRP
jgi:hypothetical protein